MAGGHALARFAHAEALAYLARALKQLQARSQTLETEEERSLFWSAPPHQAVQVADEKASRQEGKTPGSKTCRHWPAGPVDQVICNEGEWFSGI